MSEQLGPVVNNWRVRNVTNITSTENGRVRIKTECFINSANGYWFAGLDVHGGASVDGQWGTVDRTGVAIQANSGVGLVSKEIWVNRTKSARSVLCSAEARVTGYAAGVSRSDIRVNVPALPHTTVSYNANGGTGAPGSQTKWWGEVLTLSGTRPTRANHTFLGWATSANGAVVYQPGGRFGSDANTILYAKWKLNTKPPTIPLFTAQRVDADGNPAESGTSVKLEAAWRCDTSGDGANTVQSVKFAVQDANGSWRETSAEASGATGTATVTLSDLSADSSWRFRVVVKDKYGTVTSFTTVGPQRFLLDFSADGRGIGIGVGAPAEGVAINGSPVIVNGCRVPRIYAGSKVITPAASSNRHTLFTADEWASLTGTDIADGYPTVLVSNGDVTAQNVAVTGAGYSNSDKRWYVWLASSISTVFRVNYTVII